MATNYGTFFYPSYQTGSNPSVGVNGQTAPTSATEVAGVNPSGNLQPLQTDSSGNLYVSLNADTIGDVPVNVNQVGGLAFSLGQQLAASSLPVVLTAAQLSTLTPLSTVTVVQPTAANLNATVTQAGTWNITNISGTISLPTGASTAANQTNGTQKTQLVDGSGNVQGPFQTLSSTNYAPVVLASSAISGSAVVSRSIQIAGSDGTNARTISTDTTGRVNVNSSVASHTFGNAPVLTSYTGTPVTSAAYVQIIASTTNPVNIVEIFDSSGQTIYFATGASGSEVNQFIIYPGGNGQVPFSIPAGTRISYKATGTSATTGINVLNLYD